MRVRGLIASLFFRRFALIALAIPALFSLPSAAYAACSSPAGAAGDQIYNSTFNLMQFCNGADWINMGGVASSALVGLTDVDVTGAADGNCLVYDSGTSKWLDGSCGVAALQGQNDPGACTIAKDGLIRYNPAADPRWEYCHGGTTSWLPFKLPQCQDNGTGECSLSALRSADDPQFTASKIQCGENILGVTGTFGSGSSSSFSFTDATNVNPSTLTTASSVTISGLPAGCPGQVTVSGQGSPQISIAGGGWTNYGTIANGEMLAVRLTSSASFSTANTATISIGATQDSWSVTTRAQDATPDAFSFTDVTNQPVSSVVTSNTITPAGYEGSIPVSVSGQGSPQISINGGAWVTSGTITAGQTLAVRLTSSAAYVTALSATVDVGGVTDNWSVTTIPEVTFLTSSTNTLNSGGTTHSHSGLNIGTASSVRLVVALVTARNGSGTPDITSVTIGGISAAEVHKETAYNSGVALSAIYAAIVPTGTTASVVINYDSSMQGSAVVLASFSGFSGINIGSANGSAVTTSSTTASATGITTPAGGVKFAVCASEASTTTTITNASERYDFQWTAGNSDTHASAWDIHPTQQTNQTITCTFANSENRLSISAASLTP